MCNPFAIKSMGFWDYLVSEQPCSTVTQYSQETEIIQLLFIILVLFGVILTIYILTTRLDA